MFEIRNEAGRATVYLYGTIGNDFWDEESSNTAKKFSRTLDELTPKPLDIRIDSSGGDVYEGFAIASAIQRYEGETTVYIDGLAASAASYIALMGDKVVMNDYAQIMVHNAWTYNRGNAESMRTMAERLEALDANIAGIIASRSSLEVEDVREAMAAETWYSAADALAAGLADEVIETDSRMAASIDPAFLGVYAHIPESVIAAQSDETEAAEPGQHEESDAADKVPVRDEADERLIVLANRIYRIKE